jgi:hypothetical protein
VRSKEIGEKRIAHIGLAIANHHKPSLEMTGENAMKIWKSVIVLFALCASWNVVGVEPGTIYEIRNYHFQPTLADEYRIWARDLATPHLRSHFDVVGFWVGTDIPPRVSGKPLDELGQANVTWIIRWDSMEQRDQQSSAVYSSPEWQEIYAQVPGGRASYLRMEARFFQEP